MYLMEKLIHRNYKKKCSLNHEHNIKVSYYTNFLTRNKEFRIEKERPLKKGDIEREEEKINQFLKNNTCTFCDKEIKREEFAGLEDPFSSDETPICQKCWTEKGIESKKDKPYYKSLEDYQVAIGIKGNEELKNCSVLTDYPKWGKEENGDWSEFDQEVIRQFKEEVDIEGFLKRKQTYGKISDEQKFFVLEHLCWLRDNETSRGSDTWKEFQAVIEIIRRIYRREADGITPKQMLKEGLEWCEKQEEIKKQNGNDQNPLKGISKTMEEWMKRVGEQGECYFLCGKILKEQKRKLVGKETRIHSCLDCENKLQLEEIEKGTDSCPPFYWTVDMTEPEWEKKLEKRMIKTETDSAKKMKEKMNKNKPKPTGFNSVDSCPNCNPCLCPTNKKECNAKISRHEFSNPYEFSDEALLEELIIRIKKGCIEIKKDKDDWYWFDVECQWDLAKGMKKDEETGKIIKDEEAEENYILSFQALIDIHEKYRKLEDEEKLCDICLYKTKKGGTDEGIFCEDCWERETRKIDQINSKRRKIKPKENDEK
jgi:hypothetical protein